MAILCLLVGGFLGVVLMSLFSSSDNHTPCIELGKVKVTYTDDIETEIQKMIDFYSNSNPVNDYEIGSNSGALAALETLKDKVETYSKEVDIVTNVG